MDFATKPQLAQQMLKSIGDAGIRPAWVVADEVYGRDGSFWWWLEKTAKQPYVLTVSKKQAAVIGWKPYRAEDLLDSIEPQQWQRLSCGNGSKGEREYDCCSPVRQRGQAWGTCGNGSKGEREYDWARIEVNCDRSEGFQRWLVFRRSLERPHESRCISYYQVFAPAATSLETIVRVVGKRWCIEECFKLAKNQLGLGDYEVRSWQGWHRHMTLVLAASVFLSVLRAQVEPMIEADNSSPPLTLTGPMAVFKAARGL